MFLIVMQIPSLSKNDPRREYSSLDKFLAKFHPPGYAPEKK